MSKKQQDLITMKIKGDTHKRLQLVKILSGCKTLDESLNLILDVYEALKGGKK